MEKRKVSFAERILIKAIALDKDLKEGKLEPEITTEFLETGVKTQMGSFSCFYKHSKGNILIDFYYKEYLLLGTYKGKEVQQKSGIVIKGRFKKKTQSNWYRGELKLVRESLKNQGFQFKDIYEKKPNLDNEIEENDED